MRRLANHLEASAAEQLIDVLVHDPAQVLLVAEVLSPSNRGDDWLNKNHLYAGSGIPWYLLVEFDDQNRPMLVLQRLEAGSYAKVARAECGQSLRLPEPLGEIDPAVLLRR